jgi:hypothetical protein
MQFQYSSLLDGDHIRLLRILSASKYGISVTLVTTALDSAPSYNALSYTWGNPLSHYIATEETIKSYTKENCSMMCNGRVLKIGKNLRDALIAWHNAVPTPKSEHLWADAVCINQEDLDEKAVQVRMMEQIFRKASKVVAWLGPEDETTTYVFELLSRLSSLPLGHISSVDPEDMWRPEAHVGKLGIQPLNFRHWLSWVAFAHRPYFKRVWIIQESQLAGDIIGVCGSHVFDWDTLISTWCFLARTGWATLLYTEQIRCNGVIPRNDQLGVFKKLIESKSDAGMGAFRLLIGRMHIRDKQYTLTTLLMRYRYCSSTDPRDMVYALIGVARKNFKPFDTQPQLLDVSYRISVTELYIRTARSLMLADGHLNHLTLKEGSLMTKIEGLPSWVPDYSAELMPEPLSERCESGNWIQSWNASGNLAWKPMPSSLVSRYLDVQGRFMGVVDDVAMDPLLAQSEDDIAYFWDSISKLVLELQMPYAASFAE